jgi:hypothetical protein
MLFYLMRIIVLSYIFTSLIEKAQKKNVDSKVYNISKDKTWPK